MKKLLLAVGAVALLSIFNGMAMMRSGRDGSAQVVRNDTVFRGDSVIPPVIASVDSGAQL